MCLLVREIIIVLFCYLVLRSDGPRLLAAITPKIKAKIRELSLRFARYFLITDSRGTEVASMYCGYVV